MSELFSVGGKDFVAKLDEKFGQNEKGVTLVDIFETYIDMAASTTNMLDKNMLRALVFKQFKNYGDFDQQVQETAQTVSHISESTENVVNAIERNDTGAIKHAYNELKKYQKRIFELEENLFTDDLTKVLSRKYLFSKVLSHSQFTFKEDGVLFAMGIDNLEQINDTYGPSVADSALKKFSQTVDTALKQRGTQLIRYTGNEFIALTTPEQKKDIDVALKLLQKSFQTKKFKAPNDQSLQFNFHYSGVDYKKDAHFDDIYKEGMHTL